MSYMAILRYGRELKGSIVVFGQTTQICGARLFDRLCRRESEEHWGFTAEACTLFRISQVGRGVESRYEIRGAAKEKALREMLQGLAS